MIKQDVYGYNNCIVYSVLTNNRLVLYENNFVLKGRVSNENWSSKRDKKRRSSRRDDS